jgi:putative membrane protein
MNQDELARPSRLHPLAPALDLLRLIPVAVAVGLGPGRASGSPVAVAAVVLLVGTAYGYLRWRARTWWFDGVTLHVDEGVLQRQQRRIPASRVQEVAIVEPVVLRLFGLVRLRVETAGGGRGAEADLAGLSQPTAAALREAITRARASTGEGGGGADAPAGAGEVALLRLTPGRLALAGATSWTLPAVPEAVGSIVAASAVGVVAALVSRAQGALGTVAGASVVGVAVLGLLLAAAVVTAVVVDFDLTVSRTDDRLRVTRGLLSRAEAVIPLHRVQSVRIDQSPLQRSLSMASLHVQSAGLTGRAQEGPSTEARLPLLTRAEVVALLAVVLPGAPPVDELRPAPPPARSRALVRRVGPAALLSLALVVVEPLGALAAGVLLGPLAILAGLDAYRSLGYRLEGSLLVSRSGSLVRRTVVVAPGKAQSGRVVSSPLQRRRGLATLLVDLAAAGRSPRVIDQHEPLVEELLSAVTARPATRPR